MYVRKEKQIWNNFAGGKLACDGRRTKSEPLTWIFPRETHGERNSAEDKNVCIAEWAAKLLNWIKVSMESFTSLATDDGNDQTKRKEKQEVTVISNEIYRTKNQNMFGTNESCSYVKSIMQLHLFVCVNMSSVPLLALQTSSIEQLFSPTKFVKPSIFPSVLPHLCIERGAR